MAIRTSASKAAAEKTPASKTTSASKATDKNTQSTRSTVARQRAIQREAAAKSSKAPAKASKTPVQAGTRRQPQKLPAQHLRKPGNEHELALQPRFLAPDYRGSGKLEGMAAIVTGGDSGIGRAVAVLFAREGADVAVLYLNEHEDAE